MSTWYGWAEIKVRTYAWKLRGNGSHDMDGLRPTKLGWKVLCTIQISQDWLDSTLYQLWLPSGQWLGHISRYLHDFFEVPSQCLNIIIETNWFLSTTWSITTRFQFPWCRWLGVDISTDRVCIPTYQSTYTMFLRPPADVLIVLLKWFQKLGV